MFVLGRGKLKTIGFRPSEKSDEAINLLLKNKEAKSKSEAVNILIERGLSSQSELGEATGIIVQCPMRPVPFPPKKPFQNINLPVDSSICKTCSKYPCDAWKDIESWAKVSPRTTSQPLHDINKKGV